MSFNVEILAAGFGTRLNKIGEKLPKGLIPYENTTLLGRMLSGLKKSDGEFNITLVTNNRFFQDYYNYLAKNYPELNIRVINNGVDLPENRFGALGDLKLALDKLNWYDKDLLVLPSDTYFTFPISDLLAFYRKHEGFVTVFRELSDNSSIKNRLGCGVLQGDKVIKFIEKPEYPPSNFAAVPLYIYPQELLPRLNEYIEAGGNLDSPGQIIGWLIKKQIPVFGFTYQGDYLDVGTPSDLDTLKTL